MHMIVSESELATIRRLLESKGKTKTRYLPDGTTIAEMKENNSKVLFLYKIQDSELTVMADYADIDREPTAKELKELKAQFTKAKIVDFFTEMDDFVPMRKYTAAQDKMDELFSYTSASPFKNITESTPPEEPRFGFRISLLPDSPTAKVMREVNMWLKVVRKKNPTWDPIIVDVSEYTCSENGAYYLTIADNSKTQLILSVLGQAEVIKDFSTVKDAINYIKEHHPYKK